MGYLYGDATESALDHNYLEFLKAAVEFAAGVLESGDRVRQFEEESQQKKRDAAREREQIATVERALTTTIDQCLTTSDAPLTNKCVHQVRVLTRGEIERSKGGVEKGLERELARLQSQIKDQRAGNLVRLERLLLEHDFPGSRQWTDYRLDDTGKASADLVGISSLKLAWTIELEVPPEHLLHTPLRIDRLMPQLTIDVPEMSGFIRKRVKPKRYKVTKDHVIAIQHQDGEAVLVLRTSVAERDTGFDITFRDGLPVQVVRLYRGKASDPSEPEAEDVAPLQELFGKLTGSLGELRNNRRVLRSARLDDKPLARHAQPSVLVERLVDEMAPVVREISQHSLSPTELVLKRVLADDQRVEIFASKAELHAKVETLSPDSKRVFDALELDQPNPVPSLIPPSVASRPDLAEADDAENEAPTAQQIVDEATTVMPEVAAPSSPSGPSGPPPPPSRRPPPPSRRKPPPPPRTREASVDVSLDDIDGG